MTPSTPTLPGRLAPLAKRAADDDDLKAAVSRAMAASRKAIFKPAPPPKRLQRAGIAIREAGAAISFAGRNAEKQRKAEQRATRLRAGLIGGGAAGLAAVGTLLRRASAKRSTEPEPIIVEEAVVVETTSV